jgi:hypothetical protein
MFSLTFNADQTCHRHRQAQQRYCPPCLPSHSGALPGWWGPFVAVDACSASNPAMGACHTPSSAGRQLVCEPDCLMGAFKNLLISHHSGNLHEAGPLGSCAPLTTFDCLLCAWQLFLPTAGMPGLCFCCESGCSMDLQHVHTCGSVSGAGLLAEVLATPVSSQKSTNPGNTDRIWHQGLTTRSCDLSVALPNLLAAVCFHERQNVAQVFHVSSYTSYDLTHLCNH